MDTYVSGFKVVDFERRRLRTFGAGDQVNLQPQMGTRVAKRTGVATGLERGTGEFEAPLMVCSLRALSLAYVAFTAATRRHWSSFMASWGSSLA